MAEDLDRAEIASIKNRMVTEVNANAAYAMEKGYNYSEGPMQSKTWLANVKEPTNPWAPVVAAGEILLFIAFVIWVVGGR